MELLVLGAGVTEILPDAVLVVLMEELYDLEGAAVSEG